MSDEQKIREEKSFHAGHRKRVKSAIDNDPDFNARNDHEILEYLLFATIPRGDTKGIAHELLNTFGNLSAVLHATVDELLRVENIGEKSARLLSAILPTARRAEISRLRNNRYIRTSGEAARYLYPFFLNLSREYLYMVTMDINGRVLQLDLISAGTANGADVNLKEIVGKVCRSDVSSVVIAHNHPAMSSEPSREDIRLTERLVLTLASLHITFHDHLIFTGEGYYSFFEKKQLEHLYAKCDSYFGTDYVRQSRDRKYTQEQAFREGDVANAYELPVKYALLREKKPFDFTPYSEIVVDDAQKITQKSTDSDDGLFDSVLKTMLRLQK